MEAGVYSVWISEQLKEYGHEVIVANVTELHSISRNDSKSDLTDAEKLARYARLDPRILRPITLRTVEQQQALTMIPSTRCSCSPSHRKSTYRQSSCPNSFSRHQTLRFLHNDQRTERLS
jgi:hypothetical protein